MAKKTQESLLGEVVQLLRKQNQLSTRDRLKEAEEAKRQEKADEAILNPNSKTSATGEPIINDAQDFKRRYKANIAGKITKEKMDAPKNRAKKKVQEVIKHSTFMTRRLIEKSNKMMYRINVENTNDDLLRFKYRKARDQKKDQSDEEYRREHGGEMFDFTKKFRKMIAGFLSPRELARQKKREEWSIIKENWFKYGMIPLITALTASITLAYNGMHLWHTKALATLAAVKTWGTTTIGAWLKDGKIATAYTSLKTSIYAWFGYDKAGKPIYTKVDGEWKKIGWAGLTESVKTRLADIRLKAYNAIGLGPDGKPLGARPGPRGSLPVRAAWMSAGYAALLTRRLNTMFSPVTKLSGGIAKWTSSTSGKLIKDTFKTFANLGAVKFIGRLLWPIAAIFSVFEGFKAGKAEAAEDDAKWYTILGEAGGGAIGYLVGGLADAIKGLAVWGIRKMFGLETDADGNILPGQGIGGDALAAIQRFSFADLIHKIIAFPFHAISAISDYIGELLSDPLGTAGDMWSWVTDLPGKFVNWIKDLIPDWEFQFPKLLGGGTWNLRKALGIDDEGAESMTSNYIAHYASNTDPATGKKMGVADLQAMKTKYGEDWRFGESASELFRIANERQVALRIAEIQNQDGYTARGAAVNVTNIIQYKDEGYGDYIKSTRLEATM